MSFCVHKEDLTLKKEFVVLYPELLIMSQISHSRSPPISYLNLFNHFKTLVADDNCVRRGGWIPLPHSLPADHLQVPFEGYREDVAI